MCDEAVKKSNSAEYDWVANWKTSTFKKEVIRQEKKKGRGFSSAFIYFIFFEKAKLKNTGLNFDGFKKREVFLEFVRGPCLKTKYFIVLSFLATLLDCGDMSWTQFHF